MSDLVIDHIQRIEAIRLERGDLVVVHIKQQLPEAVFARIYEKLKAALPEGVQAIMLDGDVSLEVYRPIRRGSLEARG